MRYILTLNEFLTETVYQRSGFEAILNPKNQYAYIENEKNIPSGDPNISILKGDCNEYRFRYMINNQAVAGIEFQPEYNTIKLQNIYTLPEHRRQGYAQKLYDFSQAFFRKRGIRMVISNNRSDDFDAFMSKQG